MSVYVGDKKVACFCPFPVGSVMIMVNNVSPATSFPGTTWEKLDDGRFLRNQTDNTKIGNTGGSDELVSLIGAGWKSGYGSDGNFIEFLSAGQWTNTQVSTSNSYVISDGSKGLGWGVKSESFAARASRVRESGKLNSSETDTNSNKVNPKYIDCAMWKRTA